MPIDLSLGPWGASIDELGEAAAAAESSGFECAWVPELHRSPFVPAAALASATDRIQIGTGIALAFVRSPMTIALTALDVDEWSGGRFRLGLGTGVRRLNEDWHNADFGSPAAHLRETIEIIRLLWRDLSRGRPIDHEGDWERVRLRGFKRPFHQERTEIPIYMAAVGPMMTRLAGEMADGWIAHELGSPAYLSEVVFPNLETGQDRSGRTRTDIKVVASACCLIDTDGREAKRQMAGLIAFYATVKTYSDFFAWHGFSSEAENIRSRFRAGDTAGMLDAVSTEMVDTLALAGSPDEVRAGIRRYESIADEVKLTPPTHYVSDDITRQGQSTILEWLGT